MSGETDLGILLRTLAPVLDEIEFGFGIVANGAALPAGFVPLGTFVEAEGMTVIAPAVALADSAIPHTQGFARISLSVHSALEAVGLTAAIASALAEAGLSANVVAGYHHDHVFVPWDRRHEAMDVLNRLARR
jgi:hypothetical protein